MFQQDHRPIASLRIAHTVKSRLAENGYRTIADLCSVDPTDLSVELGIGLSEAEEIIASIISAESGPSQLPVSALNSQATQAARSTQAQPQTASELLKNSYISRFSTLSDPIDRLIGQFTEISPIQTSRKGKEKAGSYASIVPGTSLEISGPPGSGKTAMAIALALSARLDRMRVREQSIEVLDEVLLVDTEGSIPPERLKRAAECLTRNTSESPFDLVKGIHLLRIATQVQLVALLHTLDEWLQDHPKVNLVIFDTLSFHLRQPNLDMRTRSRFMELIKQQVGKATTIRNCAVIVINQLATKLLTSENRPANFETGDRAVLMPQLGDSWTTSKTIRLVLFRGGRNDERRYAHASSVAGSKSMPWARFDIDHDGLPCNPVEDDSTDDTDADRFYA